MQATVAQAVNLGLIGLDKPNVLGQRRHFTGNDHPTLDPAVDRGIGSVKPGRGFVDSHLSRLTPLQPGRPGQARDDGHT